MRGVDERMNKIFLDTNIIVYANDNRDTAKQDVALEIIGSQMANGVGVISTQVMQEYASVALGKLGLPADVVARQLALLEAFEVIRVEPATVSRAVELCRVYQLSFWDACILSAAESAGCSQLLSEDLNTGQLYSGIRVVNPFTGYRSAHATL